MQDASYVLHTLSHNLYPIYLCFTSPKNKEQILFANGMKKNLTAIN